MDFFTDHLFIVVWLGALAGDLFGHYKKPHFGVTGSIKELFPKFKDTTIKRIDTILTPLLAALLAYFLLQPENLQSAILNGLTCHVTLATIFNMKEK